MEIRALVHRVNAMDSSIGLDGPATPVPGNVRSILRSCDQPRKFRIGALFARGRVPIFCASSTKMLAIRDKVSPLEAEPAGLATMYRKA